MKQKGICMKCIIYITIACLLLISLLKKDCKGTSSHSPLKECLEEGLQKQLLFTYHP